MKTRLFVSAALGNEAELTLTGEQARYLGRALRLKPGDRIAVFNGDDGEWAASIEGFGRNEVSLSIDARVESIPESSLEIHLVQGISRGERMDFVVQKATELGVRRITPVITDHGMVKLDERRRERRTAHWRAVATSACEQSGRTRPPEIDEPQPLNHWFGAADIASASALVLAPGALQAFTDITEIDSRLCLLIGPEGGLSDREYEDAAVAGFRAVSLGPRTLRTETAAVAAIAIAHSRWGDFAA